MAEYRFECEDPDDQKVCDAVLRGDSFWCQTCGKLFIIDIDWFVDNLDDLHSNYYFDDDGDIVFYLCRECGEEWVRLCNDPIL